LIFYLSLTDRLMLETIANPKYKCVG